MAAPSNASNAATAPAAAATATAANAATETAKAAGWCAMESNPDVLTKFIHSVGVAKNFAFTDVLGTDPDLLAMIPAPVEAIVLLFPMPNSNAATAAATTDAKNADAKKADAPKDGGAAAAKNGPFFLIQTPELGNACGTVATLHALFNSESVQKTIDAASPVAAFMKATAALSARERGVRLSSDKALKAAHDACAAQGQTVSSGDADEDTEHHFVVFLPFSGKLFELDGLQDAPIDHGALSASEPFAVTAAAAITKHYLKNPKFGASTSFSMLAITGDADALDS